MHAVFDYDGLRFRYTDTGKGIPFLFQHGLGGSIEQPLSLFTPPQGIRLISFDFRGHGQSPLGPTGKLNIPSFAEDMRAFLDHLGLESAVVGGTSMGAAASLEFALRFPSRTLGLVLSRPAWLDGPMAKENRQLFHKVFILIRAYGPEAALDRFILSDDFIRLAGHSPGAARSFIGYFTDSRASETAAKYELIPASAPGFGKQAWRQIGVPVLILVNKADPVHPFEYGPIYAAAIPQAECREIVAKSVDEGRHLADVQQQLERFLIENIEKRGMGNDRFAENQRPSADA